MNTILSEYFTLGTSVGNIVYFVLWHFLKPVTLSLWTISLDSSMFVVKKYACSNSKDKSQSR